MFDVNYLIENGVDVNRTLDLFGDIDTYNNIIGEFLVSAKEKLEKLEKYKEEKDLANYTIYIHSLRSDAKYFGFTKLDEITSEQEEKSKEGDVFYIYEHFPTLQAEVERMLNVVKRYISNEPIEEETNQAVTQPAPAPQPVVVTTPAQQPSPAENLPEPYTQKTILVADDSNIIRNFVKRIFSEKYNVGVAQNGEEVLNIIKANANNEEIVAILLDLNMPKIDGFAVLEYMKENNLFSKFPVSIISGDSSKETIDKAFKYQIVDMLGKPFNESSIRSAVEKTIYYKEMM